jgi:hypothetical protein
MKTVGWCFLLFCMGYVSATVLTDHQYDLSKIQNAPDALAIALQLGRLDFITVVLTSLAIILAILGVIGWEQLNKAKEAAIKLARDAVEELLPSHVAAHAEAAFNTEENRAYILSIVEEIMARERDVAASIDENTPDVTAAYNDGADNEQ